MLWTPRNMRIVKEKKQQEIADLLGLSVRQYKRKESFQAKWYAHELLLLAQFYDVKAEIFFDSLLSGKRHRVKEETK